MKQKSKRTIKKIVCAVLCAAMLMPITAIASAEDEAGTTAPVIVDITPLMLSAEVMLEIGSSGGTVITIDPNEDNEEDIITPGVMTVRNISAAPISIKYSTIEYAGVWDGSSAIVPENAADCPDAFESYTTGTTNWSELSIAETKKRVAFAMIVDSLLPQDMMPGSEFTIGTLSSRFSPDGNEKELIIDMKAGYAWEEAISHKYDVTLILSIAG